MKLYSKKLQIGMKSAAAAQVWARLYPSRNAYSANLMVISRNKISEALLY